MPACSREAPPGSRIGRIIQQRAAAQGNDMDGVPGLFTDRGGGTGHGFAPSGKAHCSGIDKAFAAGREIGNVGANAIRAKSPCDIHDGAAEEVSLFQ